MGWAGAEIAEMYRTFSTHYRPYARPWDPERARAKSDRGSDPRQMSGDELFAEWGDYSYDEQTFKIFFPRVLELYATADEAVDLDHCLRELSRWTPLADWPIGEQGAFEIIIHALWLRNLEEYPGRWPGGGFLEYFAPIFEGDWFFKPWLRHPELPAVRHLAKFITEVHTYLFPQVQRLHKQPGPVWIFERFADPRITRPSRTPSTPR